MKRIAVFTGAGASHSIGYSLTRQILPHVRAELHSGELFHELNTRSQEAADRESLSRYLRATIPAFEIAPDDDLPLITDVFSLVEYALISGDALPAGGEGTLRHYRNLLKQAITDVLLGEFLKPWDRDDADDLAQEETLGRLVSFVQQDGAEVGVISTNYDIGLDSALYEGMDKQEIDTSLDLGFDWRRVSNGNIHGRPAEPALRLFKLHGSLDLLRCPMCGYVYFNPNGGIVHHAFRNELDDMNTCHCSSNVRLELHIVPPSFVRDVREPSLLSVWRSALEWLRTTEEWLIIGYSLPPEDVAIRSLLLRAYFARKKPPRVTVIQQGDKALPQYRVMFPDSHYFGDGLPAFLRNSS